MFAHQIGQFASLSAAVLFGLSTPLAKWLLAEVGPWTLAGLLYAGSAVGLTLYRCARRRAGPVRPHGREWLSLASAIGIGGVGGTVLLMVGLRQTEAATASLLLNSEVVFTALLAWFLFHENVDRRIAVGLLAIVAGTGLLSWAPDTRLLLSWPALAIVGACLCWATDDNLTRSIAHLDAIWLASVKGVGAGTVNLALAVLIGESLPAADAILAGLLLGCISYGFSLALFVTGLRHVGTARAGAYFSVAPLFGAAVSVPLLGEPVTARLLGAAALMALGVWLHLTERHSHVHTHEPLDHEHEHVHDEHHRHEHDEPVADDVRHSHPHRHEPVTHAHTHFPDIHHRHRH